jgi:predicted RNase H-like HicB family nuclease
MVPELPGCFSQGERVDEAIFNCREAIELHLAGMIEDGEDIPEEEPCVIASVDVGVPARVS